MSAVIEKRITKLENELLPKPAPEVTVIFAPAPDADPAAVAHYREQITQDRNSKHSLIVVSFQKPDQPAA